MDSLTITDIGKIFALNGKTVNTSKLLISLAVKFQQYGKVLFIDANHQFNPTFINQNYHKNQNLDLKKIKVARPFTHDQFITLINELHKTIPQNNAKAIVISGFDRFFKFDDSQMEEAIGELAHVSRKFSTFTLISLAKKCKVISPFLSYECHV